VEGLCSVRGLASPPSSAFFFLPISLVFGGVRDCKAKVLENLATWMPLRTYSWGFCGVWVGLLEFWAESRIIRR
jgi:hypothetical protein